MTPDQPITLFLAIFGSILSIVLPVRFAMAPLVLSMFLYPSTINIPPEAMQLNLSRVLVIALLGRCVASTSIRSKFKWGWPDTGAALYFGATVLSSLLNANNPSEVINNRLGFFLSAMAPFWCARLVLTDRERLYTLFKIVLWASAGLAVEGLSEMVTGYDPWLVLIQYSPMWLSYGGLVQNTRDFMGQNFTRATGPFVQCIMFGWFFALLMAPMTNLFFEKKKLFPWILAWLALPVGIISAIAAGPMSMAAISVALTCLFPLRRFWKIGVGVALLAFMVVSVGSNRTPMEIVAQFGFDASSSWFRVGLLQTTFNGGMKDHWFAGYGLIPKSYDSHRDLCIHWVAILVFYGMLGVVGFHAMLVCVCVPLWKSRGRAVSIGDQWLLWSFMSTVLASILALQLVDLFSEMYHIYLMFLGIIANAAFFIGESSRQVGVMADLNGQRVMLRYTLKPGQRLALVRTNATLRQEPTEPATPAEPQPPRK